MGKLTDFGVNALAKAIDLGIEGKKGLKAGTKVEHLSQVVEHPFTKGEVRFLGRVSDETKQMVTGHMESLFATNPEAASRLRVVVHGEGSRSKVLDTYGGIGMSSPEGGKRPLIHFDLAKAHAEFMAPQVPQVASNAQDVNEYIRDSLTHEWGHQLHSNFYKGARVSQPNRKLLEGFMDAEGPQVRFGPMSAAESRLQGHGSLSMPRSLAPSLYAHSNINEFIAEAYTKGKTDPQADPFYRAVVQRLERPQRRMSSGRTGGARMNPHMSIRNRRVTMD